MNSESKKILAVGAFVIALMLLFPPWDYFDNDSSGRLRAGYHFFLTPPEPRPAKEIFGRARFPHQAEVQVDVFRLIIQLSMVIPTTFGLALLFKQKRSVLSFSFGILFIVCAVLVFGTVVWLVLSLRFDNGYWVFP